MQLFNTDGKILNLKFESLSYLLFGSNCYCLKKTINALV